MDIIDKDTKNSIYFSLNQYNDTDKMVRCRAEIHKDSPFFNTEGAVFIAAESFKLTMSLEGGVVYKNLPPDWEISGELEERGDHIDSTVLRSIEAFNLDTEQDGTGTIDIRPESLAPDESTNNLRSVLQEVASDVNDSVLTRNANFHVLANGVDQLYEMESNPALTMTGPGFGQMGLDNIRAKVIDFDVRANDLQDLTKDCYIVEVEIDKQDHPYVTRESLGIYFSSGLYIFSEEEATSFHGAVARVAGPYHVVLEQNGDFFAPDNVPREVFVAHKNKEFHVAQTGFEEGLYGTETEADNTFTMYWDDQTDGPTDGPNNFTHISHDWIVNAGETWKVKVAVFWLPNATNSQHGKSLYIGTHLFFYTKDGPLRDNISSTVNIKALSFSDATSSGAQLDISNQDAAGPLEVKLLNHHIDKLIVQRTTLSDVSQPCYNLNEMFSIYNPALEHTEHDVKEKCWELNLAENGGFKLTTLREMRAFSITKNFADAMGLTENLVIPHKRPSGDTSSIELVILPLDGSLRWRHSDRDLFADRVESHKITDWEGVEFFDTDLQTTIPGANLTAGNIATFTQREVQHKYTHEIGLLSGSYSKATTNTILTREISKATIMTNNDGIVVYHWDNPPVYSYVQNTALITAEQFSEFTSIELVQSQGPVFNPQISTHSAGEYILASLSLPFDFGTANTGSGHVLSTSVGILGDATWVAPAHGSQFLRLISSGKIYDCAIVPYLRPRDASQPPVPLQLPPRGVFNVKIKLVQRR